MRVRTRTTPLVVFAMLACGPDAPAIPSTPPPDTVAAISAVRPAGSDTAPAATPTPPGPATALDSMRRDLAEVRALLEQRAPADSTDAAPAVPTDPSAGDIVQGAARSARFLGIRVFWAVVVLLVAYALVRVTSGVLDALAERFATRRLFVKRLVPIVRLLIWSFAVYYVVAGVFQVDRASLLAATAAVGVAVGFAAQDVLKNIFGGFIIILDRPFQVGDKIRVDDTYGEVVAIGLRATRIVTADDNLVSVPNLRVVESQVANANSGALDCQVVVDLFLPGWVDVTEAKRIAYDAAASSPYVFLDKPIVVNVRDEFREGFVTHLLVKSYVVDTRFEFTLASDITETAKREYRRLGWLPPMVKATVTPHPSPA